MNKSSSQVGKIVDMKMRKFKKYVRNQPLGVCCNMRNMLQSSYAFLVNQKDSVLATMQNLDEGSEEYKEYRDNVHGIYSLMQKIEDKSVFLNDHIKEVMDSRE